MGFTAHQQASSTTSCRSSRSYRVIATDYILPSLIRNGCPCIVFIRLNMLSRKFIITYPRIFNCTDRQRVIETTAYRLTFINGKKCLHIGDGLHLVSSCRSRTAGLGPGVGNSEGFGFCRLFLSAVIFVQERARPTAVTIRGFDLSGLSTIRQVFKSCLINDHD